MSPIGVDLNILENDTLNVVVMVSANPQPQQNGYTWTKDNNPITNSMVSTSLTSITFNRVSREDAGFYLLTVTNSAGRDTHSFTLTVMCKWVTQL